MQKTVYLIIDFIIFSLRIFYNILKTNLSIKKSW